LSLWDSYGLGNFELRAGNFSEDSRGRWYLNVCVPRAQRGGDQRNKPSVGSILDRSVPSLGIDLGLSTFAAFSDEAMPPIEAERFYRDLEPVLSRAQRPRHRNRSRAIHAVTSMQLTISSRRDIAALLKESSSLEGEEDVNRA